MKNKNHIIPKLILHQHATIPAGFKAHFFWMHNTQSTQDKYVPTDSQCQKHRLYELQNADSQIVPGTENMIENRLAELEKEVSPIVHSIQQNKLLSTEERLKLVLFTAIQIMRTPEVIDFTADFIQQQVPQLATYQSQQLSRMQGLLIQSSHQEINTLDTVLKWLHGYRMVIWRAPWNNTFIINQNRPVGVFMPIQGLPQNAFVVYPISATHCLAFVHDNNHNQKDYTTVLSEWVDFINYCNYTNNATLVYCKYIVRSLPFYQRLILRQHEENSHTKHIGNACC